MEREKFNKLYKEASTEIDKEKLYKEEIRTQDSSPLYIGKKGTRNLVIVIEELAELQQQLSKYLRGKEDKIGLIEEVADVYMGLDYIKQICDISDKEINKAINVKLKRLEETENIYK